VNPLLQPRYSKEEFARRGDEIYERAIRPQVEAAHTGEFVAIDIETGAYELDRDDYTATERLISRNPDAQIWLLRVGYPAAYRMGGGRSTAEQSAR
jgi:hypothetical protein